jgi:hypothetical protein
LKCRENNNEPEYIQSSNNKKQPARPQKCISGGKRAPYGLAFEQVHEKVIMIINFEGKKFKTKITTLFESLLCGMKLILRLLFEKFSI